MAEKKIIPLPDPASFQHQIGDKDTDLYFLQNSGAIQVAITNFGGRLVSLMVPDKNGQPVDVILGMDSLDGYLNAEERYFGAIIGRFANRIGYGRFTLNEKKYHLYQNLHPHSLHGGKKGFQEVVWDVLEKSDKHIHLHYLSPDGEEGYPGNLSVEVIYELTEKNELIITATASCDKDTVFNLTYHPFFNLNGQGNGKVLQHQLQINADHFLPVDEVQIPIGYYQPVANTPFDFRVGKTIGRDISKDDEQLKRGNGYDHNFIINRKEIGDLALAATATGEISEITMEVYTTEPGIQFCSGNFLAGKHLLKQKMTDEQFGAFCLEPQHFPDAPNHPSFPSTTLKAGYLYKTTTLFRFC